MVKNNMRIIGIDPGLSGAIALFVPTDNSLTVIDIPVVDGQVDVDTLATHIRSLAPVDMAIVERSSAMPKQGVSSVFKFGATYGALRAIVTLLNIPTHLVTATKWKRFFALSSDKEQSRALALRLWPGTNLFSRKKDHNRAEASLIARYGALTIAQEVKS